MKYYDKDIYEKSKRIEMYIVILCTFLIGFILGYYIILSENTNSTNSVENQRIASESEM